jgi:diaminohydroxyphosphoribosylaminopyrimidine deaminase/5-amino-6-(5-phosphoribosylamino)uracil reductase
VASAESGAGGSALSSTTSTAMSRAVELAARAWGTTSPNPVVGCVILAADGRTLVGEGYTQPPGGPHAEVEALRLAGTAARGGTAVVTLEPCHHTGRTGPCTQALLDAGIARVVIGVRDPNPVAAGGVEALTAAGVEVTVLDDADAARVNEHWLVAIRHQRPFVVWKYAASLDGRSAAADGTSRWITGPLARTDVHRLRARADAVIVGVGTVLADDPDLTVRHIPATRQPLRVVLDSDGRTPPTARVRDDSAPTLILTAEQVARHDVRAALEFLYAEGIRSVLLEGGPRLAGAFLDAGCVDEVVGYVAPVLLGQGSAALQTTGLGSTIGAALRLEVNDVTAFGPDLRVTARPTCSVPPACAAQGV